MSFCRAAIGQTRMWCPYQSNRRKLCIKLPFFFIVILLVLRSRAQKGLMTFSNMLLVSIPAITCTKFRPPVHSLICPPPFVVPGLRAFFRLVFILYRYNTTVTTRSPWTTRSPSIRLGTSGQNRGESRGGQGDGVEGVHSESSTSYRRP
jgi:hypothetical protein